MGNWRQAVVDVSAEDRPDARLILNNLIRLTTMSTPPFARPFLVREFDATPAGKEAKIYVGAYGGVVPGILNVSEYFAQLLGLPYDEDTRIVTFTGKYAEDTENVFRDLAELYSVRFYWRSL